MTDSGPSTTRQLLFQRPLFQRGSPSETLRVLEILRSETVGGFLLLGAAITAMIVANSPWAAGYQALTAARFGPASLHLDLSAGQWASDGLLAIFFFLVGLELKREMVTGALRGVRTAIVPVVAAVGGVIVPALVYLAFNAGGPGSGGWATPTATDIAFAVAVLAVVGSGLPAALRLFLLTLAVIDDLLAIVIIAVFYTSRLSWAPLLLALVPLALFAAASRRYAGFFSRRPAAAWLILLPLGIVTWALVHASGIHATIAGVVLSFAVPVTAGARGTGAGLAEQFEHRFRPLSAGFAVPVFAFFAAGVPLRGIGGFPEFITDPIALGILLGLIAGKPAGILTATWLVTKLTSSSLHPTVRWADLTGIGILAGIGFTVSLLVAELSFPDPADLAHAKLAILAASTVAAIVAGTVLRLRTRFQGPTASHDPADASHGRTDASSVSPTGIR